jgi:hypothetical protein
MPAKQHSGRTNQGVQLSQNETTVSSVEVRTVCAAVPVRRATEAGIFADTHEHAIKLAEASQVETQIVLELPLLGQWEHSIALFSQASVVRSNST